MPENHSWASSCANQRWIESKRTCMWTCELRTLRPLSRDGSFIVAMVLQASSFKLFSFLTPTAPLVAMPISTQGQLLFLELLSQDRSPSQCCWLDAPVVPSWGHSILSRPLDTVRSCWVRWTSGGCWTLSRLLDLSWTLDPLEAVGISCRGCGPLRGVAIGPSRVVGISTLFDLVEDVGPFRSAAVVPSRAVGRPWMAVWPPCSLSRNSRLIDWTAKALWPGLSIEDIIVTRPRLKLEVYTSLCVFVLLLYCIY